jgi:hypothetical protein
MTDCYRNSRAFSSPGPKFIVADFLRGRLTSDAVAMFQVGIVLDSVSLLVRFRWLHALSLVTRVVGLLCLIVGLLS